MMTMLLRSCLVFLAVLSGVASSRVLELSDKFIEISGEGLWLVKFYAPWCAHCRRLDPVWAHVAQTLYNSPIKVAKVDCTRFPAIASEYQIRAYPTIIFFKGATRHEYIGERAKDELVNYALRMSQSPIQVISEPDSLSYLKENHPIFFGYIGKQHGALWNVFSYHAEKYQPHTWFYAMSHEVVKQEINPPKDDTVFVYKENEAYFFDAKQEWLENEAALNVTLDKWINAERFGIFPKITYSNLNALMDTNKYIVIAVVSENKLNEISQTEKDFKDMIEAIVRERKRDLRQRFQFGWTGSPDLANSIVMSELITPHLIVLNSTTNHHHIPDEDPVLMTPEAVHTFLDLIHTQQAPTYGGNSWAVRLYRVVFEARTQVASMWRGNPVLTALVFGLPAGFLLLIFYSMCCADMLDAPEEDELSETHEKKD